MINKGLFSSNSDNWETPQVLFDRLNAHYHFTVDVCATYENAKVEKFFTPEMDGLKQDWQGVCWCNHPYGREIGKWVEKAIYSMKHGATIVMLLPARTDTKWFHQYLYNKPGVHIIFLEGRLKFGKAQNSAPFPSMLAILRGAFYD